MQVNVEPHRKTKLDPPVGGRRDRTPQVTQEVLDFIEFVRQERPPYVIGQWLSQYIARKLDAELELLASHVLLLEADISDPQIQGPISRGNTREGLQQLQSRMRRKFAKLLRDHQRADDDLFTDQCVVE